MAENKCCSMDDSSGANKPKALKVKVKSKDNTNGDNKGCCSSEASCGCGNEDSSLTRYDPKSSWVLREIKTAAGMVPVVSTKLCKEDIFGTWKARWGINRNNYKVSPGIYAVGSPDSSSNVLVTANYKMTFDALRKEVEGLDVWILVLDTKGINVWCAAGKGTFGTEELVRRIKKVNLSSIVSHRKLILPQLGAPGISAHEVTKHSGFKVVYGPVRAKDLKEFIASGMKATREMRTVRFTAYDRLVLTPVELVNTIKLSFVVFGIMFLLNLIVIGPFGVVDFYAYTGALLCGCVLTPVLLPWISGRAFAWKGWLLGFIWAIVINCIYGWGGPYHSVLKALAYLIILPSVSSFFAMNFTGSSTYTSISGVLKEMKVAVPAIIVSIAIGIVLFVVNSFIY